MMGTVSLPPFERLYLTHRDDVHGALRRLVGRDRADDAFQETFLRALRAYDRLAHADNLRAWLLAIARNVALDELRKTRPLDGDALPELEAPPQEQAPHEQLAELAAPLPAKERAAVVLRYAYDLDYDTIGAALGSSGEAARQAASAGVRRLRKELTHGQ
jgi:RNA polymerase sigma factor (sigma-70 family)